MPPCTEEDLATAPIAYWNGGYTKEYFSEDPSTEGDVIGLLWHL
jgi:hypothetical protein